MKYKELDKDLKRIRNMQEYDLYKTNLELQKRIDKFYNDEIPENDMMCRKYKLENSIDRKNILYFPIIITIVFGLLVNYICNKINSLPDFTAMFQELKSIPATQDNFIILMTLYFVLALLFVLVIVVFMLVFFTPFPSLLFLIESGQTKEYQIKYEIKILDEKINIKLDENKNKKDYNNSKRKYNTKYVYGVFAIIVVIFAFGICWGIAIDRICLLTVAGIIGGYFLSKI